MVLIGIAAIVVLGVIALASVRPTMVETRSAPPLDNATPSMPGPGEARVRGGNQSSGISVFDFRFGGSTTLRIEFPVDRDCYDAVAIGDPWPVADQPCETDLAVAGEITQRSDASSRGPLLVVEMDVSKECFSVAPPGSPWPTGLAECSSEEAR